MKVSFKTAFSILDGRLSTELVDVFEMLNYIFDTNFMIHQLPSAMRKLDEINPKWVQNAKNILNDVKISNNTDDFEELMGLIDKGFPTYYIKLEKVDPQI